MQIVVMYVGDAQTHREIEKRLSKYQKWRIKLHADPLLALGYVGKIERDIPRAKVVFISDATFPDHCPGWTIRRLYEDVKQRIQKCKFFAFSSEGIDHSIDIEGIIPTLQNDGQRVDVDRLFELLEYPNLYKGARETLFRAMPWLRPDK